MENFLRKLLRGGGASAGQTAKKAGAGSMARSMGGNPKLQPRTMKSSMQMPQQYERAQYRQPMPQQMQYEDDALINGQQGFSPISADIANFRAPFNYHQQTRDPMGRQPVMNPMAFAENKSRYLNNPIDQLQSQELRNRLRVR